MARSSLPVDVHRSKKPLVNTNLSTEAHVLTPRYGQYVTHTHYHITPVGAVMDSCFGVIGAHQHDLCSGKAVFRPLVSRASPGTQNPNNTKIESLDPKKNGHLYAGVKPEIL